MVRPGKPTVVTAGVSVAVVVIAALTGGDAHAAAATGVAVSLSGPLTDVQCVPNRRQIGPP